MRLAPIIVAGSFLLSGASIGAALWSTPAMRHEFANDSSGHSARAAGVLLSVVAICGWPWLASFVRAFGERGHRSAIVFAVAGVALSALFYSPISSAPTEGVGYSVIFFVLLAWVAYPLSLIVESGAQ